MKLSISYIFFFLNISIMSQFVLGQVALPDDNPKVIKAKEVLANLINARSVTTPPGLRMEVKQGNYILGAECRTNDMTIWINEKCFDICYSIDSVSLSGLAYVLGHEYGHYYLNHNDISDFIKSWYINGNTNNIDSMSVLIRKNDEKDAEIFGIQTAFVAGYDVRKTGVTVIKSIYKFYKLSDSPYYPPLQERLSLIADLALKEVEQYIPVYETGIKLYASGNYVYAAECFRHLSRVYPSKEIYNDIGTCYLLEALSTSDSTEKYIYPVEFNFNERLSNFSRGENSNFTYNLNNAILNLNIALQKDPGYITAKINLICALLLKKELYDVSYLLSKDSANIEACKIKFPQIYCKYQILKGIYNAKIGNRQFAFYNFESALIINKDYDIARINKNVINGDNITLLSLNKSIFHLSSNIIKPYDVVKRTVEPENLKPVSDFTAGKLKYSDSCNLSILYLRDFLRIKGACFVTINSDKGFVNEDISPSEGSVKLMTEKYGYPDVKSITNNGEYWNYKKSRVILFIKNNIVSELTHYFIEWTN